MKVKDKYPELKSYTADEKTGKIKNVTLEDDTSFTFDSFIDLFKRRLSTIIAGERIGWGDYVRYQKQISAEAMEVHLDVAEAKAQVAALKIPKMTKGQVIAIGTIIILIFVGVIVLMFLKSMGLIG